MTECPRRGIRLELKLPSGLRRHNRLSLGMLALPLYWCRSLPLPEEMVQRHPAVHVRIYRRLEKYGVKNLSLRGA